MNKKNSKQGFFFITPALIILGTFVILSILYIFVLSFFKVDLKLSGGIDLSFVGLDNYIKMFHDEKFKVALYNTINYAIIVVPIQIAIALVLATTLNAKIKAKNTFRAIYFLPTLTSSAALTLIFMFIFSSSGPVNAFLVGHNIIPEPIVFFKDVNFAMNTIKIMNIWATVPFLTTIFLAALVDVDKSMYEAASIDGAGRVKQFFSITVPAIRPTITFVVLTGIAGCLQIFDQAYIISGGSGGPDNSTLTVSLMIYQYAFDPSISAMGYAAAISIVFGLLIFAISQFVRYLNRKEGM